MRILKQHLKPIFYVRYIGQNEIVEDGLHTGDYRQSYGEVQTAMVYISIPRKNDAIIEGFGVNTPYTRTIVSEKNLGLKEEDLFSYGLAEIEDGDGGLINPWDAVETLNGGVMQPWTPDGEKVYKVLKIGISNHHTTYTVEEL